MAKRESRTFDLSKFRDLDITSISIKQLTGDDLIMAAERCTLPDGASIDENVFGMLLRNQLIAGAITEVDGKSVKGASCQSYLTWNMRTRDFVSRAYDFLNSTVKAERDDFQKLLEGADQPISGELDNTPDESATT